VFEEAASFARRFASDASTREATLGRAKEAAATQKREWSEWWKKNWEEANRMEPPQLARNREERRRRMREQGLYGAKEPGGFAHDDVRRYGMKVGEAGGFVQPGYNRIDGNYRMTTAFDHSYEAMEDRWDAAFHGAGRTDGGWVDPAEAAAANQRAKEDFQRRSAEWHHEQKHGPGPKGFSFTNPVNGQSAFTGGNSGPNRPPPGQR